MPELPEVEFARRCWQRWAKERTVKRVLAAPSRVLRPQKPAALRPLEGAAFTGFDRRGKNLLLTATKGRQPIGLWSHLGMTGKWVRRSTRDEAPRFSRVQIDLDDAHSLHYCDMRLFGRLRVIPAARWEEVAELRSLGPDPLVDGVTARSLALRLAGRRVPIKLALMDQSVLAGIGNIQANEGLFRARIDPRRATTSLSAAEIAALARGIRASLRHTLVDFEHAVGDDGDIAYVEEPGTPNPFLVYGRAGEKCPRCKGDVIRRLVQGGRSTFYCARCQK